VVAAVTVQLDERRGAISVPRTANTLEGFRAWVKSDAFPEKLRDAYARSKIPEYWLVDARGGAPRFEILRLAGRAYRVAATAGKPQPRAVLGATFRLRRARDRAGRFAFELGITRRTSV